MWIETQLALTLRYFESLPTRECGLKPRKLFDFFDVQNVTPHAGVWIETSLMAQMAILIKVTPHAGVWIETWKSPRL